MTPEWPAADEGDEVCGASDGRPFGFRCTRPRGHQLDVHAEHVRRETGDVTVAKAWPIVPGGPRP